MKVTDVVVIGSGPSATAAIGMLIRRGIRPQVLDAGNLDDKFLGTELRGVSAISTEVLALGNLASASVASKSWFGSSRTYDQPAESPIEYSAKVGARATYQLGGFSRIWGGTFDLSECDKIFPVSVRPSDEHREYVRQLVPNSLTSLIDTASREEVRGHPRFTRVFRAIERNCRQSEVEVSRARLAIDSRSGPSSCIGCHLCFVGCPVDAIWFSGTQIHEWARSGRINYQPRSVVTTLHENDGYVTIRGNRSDTPFEVKAQRVILAAGALSSSAILVNSSIYRQLRLQDTSASYGAALSPSRWQSTDVVQHGLSQIWIRFPESHVAQLYAPDSVHLPKLRQRLSSLRKLANPVSQVLIERLIPIILIREASHSDSIELSKQGDHVITRAVTNAKSEIQHVHALNTLRKSLRGTGLFLLIPFFEQPSVGTGQHVGASLPHLSGSDELGRPPGLNRVHVVDGSVLPKIPLGSVTPLIMANATRIASYIQLTDS